MRVPKIVREQPGYDDQGTQRQTSYTVARGVMGGIRLYAWINGKWMDASLRDVPSMKSLVGRIWRGQGGAK